MTKQKRIKHWWVRERHNPQLGVYWTGMGQLSKAEAKRVENTMYGDNYMHGHATEEAYKAHLDRLVSAGEKVV